MQKVLKEDPLPPSSLNVQVPSGMDVVVRKALAKRADDRFQTAPAFADAIRSAAAASSGATAEATLVAEHGAGRVAQSDATVIGSASPAPDDAGKPARQPAAAATSADAKKAQVPAIAIVVAIAAIAIGAGAWLYLQRQGPEVGKAASSPTAQAPAATLPATQPPATASGATAPSAATAALPSEPGTMLVSAVGLIDPSEPRYQSDKALLQSDLRADSRSQTVEKVLGLLLEANSLARNYDFLKDRLLSRSGDFITTVVRESPPRLGKDGLMSITTEAVVNVRAVQKSLNQMSRDERVELIRASGDPKVSVQIDVADAEAPNVPPQPSPVAENILKDRIKSFGFRTWAEGMPGGSDGRKGADFAVIGEARIKRLSMRLQASGVTVTKFALTSWTVKCLDRETNEEIYFNTALPKGIGSWATEEEALKAIGTKIADEFSRELFLQHANVTGRKITLNVEGMPDAASEELLARELVGLPGLVAATARPPGSPRGYDVELGGSGAAGDIIAVRVLKPLNAKLGQACFSLGATMGNEVAVRFDQACANPTVLSRLETNPPAGLYDAPPSRQKSVVKNPEMLRKLTI